MPPRTKQLFISYSSTDAATVDAIAHKLRLLTYDDGTPRYSTWQDKHDLQPGHPNWWDAILDAIEACDILVFNISRASLESPVCRAELDYAHQRNRPVIPIVLAGEYTYEPLRDKRETHWDMIPDWLGKHQLLWDDDGAGVIDDFGRATALFEQDWPSDVYARRPLSPTDDTEHPSNHACYEAGCDYAERLAFVEAEKCFDALRNDADYRNIAAAWLGLLRRYHELVELDRRPHAAKVQFRRKWAEYTAQFSEYADLLVRDKLFDPCGLAGRDKSPASPKSPVIAEVPAEPLVSYDDSLLKESVALREPDPVSAKPIARPATLPETPTERPLTLAPETIHVLKGHKKQVNSVAFSPDGKLLASGSGGEVFSGDCSIRLWNVATGEQIAKLTGHTGTVWDLSFSPDGGLLVSGSADNTLRLWDVVEQKQVAELTGHTETVWDLSFSPDGGLLASGSRDKTVRLWNVAEQRQVAELTGHTDWVRCVSFSPDGQLLASGSDDKTVRLWDVAEQQQVAKLTGHTGWVESVSFSPDGGLLASGSRDNTVCLWNVAEQQQVAELTGHTGTVWGVSFSPDGGLLASGSVDNILRLWDVVEQKQVAKLVEHVGYVRSVAFSPDGQLLASGSDDQTIRIWRLYE